MPLICPNGDIKAGIKVFFCKRHIEKRYRRDILIRFREKRRITNNIKYINKLSGVYQCTQ